MTSWFPDYTKFFLRLNLRDERNELKDRSKELLKGKDTTYPLHLTLLVMHVKNDTECATFLKSEEFPLQFGAAVAYPDTIAIENARYELLGQKPECLCITFEMSALLQPFTNLKETLCKFLISKLDLTYNESTVSGEGGGYEYMDLMPPPNNNQTIGEIACTPVVRIPKTSRSCCREDKRTSHITLFSSFDLKRCNKAYYTKTYLKAEDKLALLVENVGPLGESFTNLSLYPNIEISYK